MCEHARECAYRLYACAHLDLEADPAAGAAVLVNDDVEVLGHDALHTPVLDVDAP